MSKYWDELNNGDDIWAELYPEDEISLDAPAEKPHSDGGRHAASHARTENRHSAPPAPKPSHRSEDVPREAVSRRKASEEPSDREKWKMAKRQRTRKRLQRIKTVLTVLVTLIFLLLVGATVGGYYITNSHTTLPNISVSGVKVGGLPFTDVEQVLLDGGWAEKSKMSLTVQLPADVSFDVDYIRAGALMTVEAATEAACDYGHGTNWYDNLFLYLKSRLLAVDIQEQTTGLNESYLKTQISDAALNFRQVSAGGGYEKDDENERLVFIKGAGELELDTDALYTEVVNALAAGQRELSFNGYRNEPKKPDFAAIYKDLSAEPSEAYFKENFEVVDEVNGYQFDVAEAEQLWTAAKPLERVEIPAKLIRPAVTGEMLRGTLYRDLLGSQTTYFPNSIDNRISNINLVASKLDGHIMMPGDTFSYNEFVGERTEEAGFLPAGAYENGEVIEANGGGICQVSSTLYCAAMYAQLDTVARTSHYFRVDYLPLGQDATVSWPSPDYKFRNSREYPIKIVAICDPVEKYITIEIWGTDMDGSYVELDHETYTRFDETYPDVAIGYFVLGYRNVFDSEGNFLYRVDEPASDYWFHDEDIQWPAEKQAASAPSEGGDGGGGEAPAEDPFFNWFG